VSIKSDKWIRRMCAPTREACYLLGKFIGYADQAHVIAILRGHTEINPMEVSIVDEKSLPMIEPFAERQVRGGANDRVISYGVSSYGYDVRCTDEFKIFTNINSSTVDPKNFDENCFVDFKGDVCIIPPNSFVLARTAEYFRIPRNVLTICLGKSTYARCGIIVNVTPLEPEWEGHVTLEFSNTTTLPAKIYANEGVAQMLFLESDEDCEESYKDRGGKYQGQTGINIPRM